MELTTLHNTAFEHELDLRDGTLSLAVDTNAEIKNAALVVDGQPLALSWKKAAHAWTASVEDVKRATLHVALRAVPPIRDVDGTLRVLLDEQACVTARYALAGHAKVVPGRSAWHGPRSLPFGVPTELRLRLRNDGDADYAGGSIRIAASDGVNLDGDGKRVSTDPKPHLIVAVPPLKVGAVADLTLNVKPCDPTIAKVAIAAETELAAEPLAADFPLEIEAPSLKIEAHDVEAVRFGEVLLARAVISTGSHYSPETSLHVSVTPGGSASAALGAVSAFEKRALFVAVPINDPTIDEGDAVLRATLFGDDGRAIVETEARLRVAGSAAAHVETILDEADESSAHTFHVKLFNTGDIALRDIVVKLEKRPGLVAIRDSAELDGTSILELDGSVPIFDGGIVIDRVLVGQVRHLTLRLRHNKGKALLLSATASLGEVTIATGELNATFSNGSARRADSDTKATKAAGKRAAPSSNGAVAPPAASSAEPTANTDAATPETGSPTGEAQSEAHDGATGANATQEGAKEETRTDEGATEPKTPVAEFVYDDAIPEETLALVTSGAPIGHHVAAALGLLPHGHTTESELGLAVLRLREIASQNLQLIALAHRRNAYGTSGYGIPANLLTALSDVRQAQRLAPPTDDLDAMKQLVAMADVKGSASRAVHKWRRLVLEALESAGSVNDLSTSVDASLEEVAA